MNEETETIRKMLYQSWTAQEEIEENCMTLQRLEQVFNYRFNWLSRNIDWSKYDDKIIALKKQRKSHRLIAEELGVSEGAVRKRWQTELRGR